MLVSLPKNVPLNLQAIKQEKSVVALPVETPGTAEWLGLKDSESNHEKFIIHTRWSTWEFLRKSPRPRESQRNPHNPLAMTV